MLQQARIYERGPVVWVLVGLLFNATGLYLGFDYSVSFLWMVIGWFCVAYGAALFVFHLRERPKGSIDTRLSPNFVSAGAPENVPVASTPMSDPEPRQEAN
jgi:hypothetical protein